MTEKEKKIFEMQSPATRAAMLRQRGEKELADAIYKPDMSKAQCLKEDGSVDIGVRYISTEEYNFHVKARQRRGQYIEEMRTANNKTPTVIPDKNKVERAVAAFMRCMDMKTVKDKFKLVFNSVFKPDHAEIVAEHIRRVKDEH